MIYHQPASIYYFEHRLQLQDAATSKYVAETKSDGLKPLIRIVTIAVLCCGNALFVYDCDRETKNSSDDSSI